MDNVCPAPSPRHTLSDSKAREHRKVAGHLTRHPDNVCADPNLQHTLSRRSHDRADDADHRERAEDQRRQLLNSPERHQLQQPLPEGEWREHVMGDCEYGCKVYVEQSTGQRALAHAAAYGCRKTC